MAVGPTSRTRFAHAVRWVAPILSWLPALARDVAGVSGLGAVAYGCWLIAPAAGFIVGGLELVAVCALLTAGAGPR